MDQKPKNHKKVTLPTITSPECQRDAKIIKKVIFHLFNDFCGF